MPRKESSRKFQLTINNPETHGFTHKKIRQILSEGAAIDYWCMCDETGENGTPHTHVYIAFHNSVMFDTMHKQFYGAHIEPAKGTHKENRDYIRKEGKWLVTDKRETSKPDTFEESGQLPPDKPKSETQAEQIMEMIRAGKSNAEILEACPTAYNKLNQIEQTRQTLLQERYKDEWRDIEAAYIWGRTGVGKTRSVMEKYGYANVYRVTDYAHPFDGYASQDVVLFDEFRSCLPVNSMLMYLDGYPVSLPCRYANKTACFTKVYIISNIPLNQQYRNVQAEEPETWDAFCRRIQRVIEMGNQFHELEPDSTFAPDDIFGNVEV